MQLSRFVTATKTCPSHYNYFCSPTKRFPAAIVAILTCGPLVLINKAILQQNPDHGDGCDDTEV